jgi:hypothetical protein
MNRIVVVGAIMFVFGSMTGAVNSQLLPPESRQLSLVFRSNPTDPESEVTMIVTLRMSPASIDGNDVGWQIDAVEFVRVEAGLETHNWETGPVDVADSSDGLWWVYHEDVSNPTEAEFTQLPALVGFADSEDPELSELFFFVEAGDPSNSGGGEAIYGERTAVARYSFIDGESESDGDVRRGRLQSRLDSSAFDAPSRVATTACLRRGTLALGGKRSRQHRGGGERA